MQKNQLSNGCMYCNCEKEYAVVYHLALFDTYSVHHSHSYYKSNSGKVQMFGDTFNTREQVDNFSTKADLDAFISDRSIIVLDTVYVDHPLAHGLPDCRSIH